MRTLVILLIVASLGYWWQYRRERHQKLEELQSETRNSESRIATAKTAIDKVMGTLEPLRKNKNHAESPEGSVATAEKEVEDLKESMKASLAKLDTAEADFESAVNEIRELARKQTFPELKLSGTDTVLKDCTIAKFGEGFISLSHADGITKVQSEDLPEGWAGKFAVDYVSRESKAEKEALAMKVDEATIPPLDLKNAQLGEIDSRIADIETRLVAYSAQIREATRKADQLMRDAYRAATDKGARTDAVAAKRSSLFKESKAVEAGREEIRKKYVALRQQKQALEKQRTELRRKKVTAVP